jgi:hypothetical protein
MLYGHANYSMIEITWQNIIKSTEKALTNQPKKTLGVLENVIMNFH